MLCKVRRRQKLLEELSSSQVPTSINLGAARRTHKFDIHDLLVLKSLTMNGELGRRLCYTEYVFCNTYVLAFVVLTEISNGELIPVMYGYTGVRWKLFAACFAPVYCRFGKTRYFAFKLRSSTSDSH